MVSTSRCPYVAELQAFVLGRYTPKATRALAEHILTCSRCLALLPTLKTDDPLIEAMRAQPAVALPPADQEVVNRLMRRLIEQRPAVPSAFEAKSLSSGDAPEIPASSGRPKEKPAMSANWFVAIKGKRQGPITAEQLKQWASSGQLQPNDMVLQEGGSQWAPASAVRGLFSSAVGSACSAAANGTPWFYAQNKQRNGPVSLTELKELARSGQLQPTDMCMQVGSQGWVAGNAVPGLFGGSAATVHDGMSTVDQGIVAAGARNGPPGSVGKIGRAARSLFGGARDFAMAASQEAARRAKLASLRKDVDRLHDEVEKRLPREVGTLLLNNGVRIPGCESLAKSFGKLNKDFNMANQAALMGNKDKKKEAAKIAEDLEPVLLSYGRGALESNISFENRAGFLDRKRKLEAELDQKKAQLVELEKEWEATSKGKKRGVMAAFGLVAAVLLITAGVSLWALSGLFPPSKPGPVIPGPIDLTKVADKDPAYWYEKFSLSVPVVEAVGRGHGSGILIESQGKLYVLTNRHVVQNSGGNIAVHFIRKTADGKDEKLTVPGSHAAVLAIHNKADLAVIDVNKASADVRTKWKVPPLQLAPKGHRPKVGERVFAIGHPGDGGNGILYLTLSAGEVSQIGREYENCTFTQITVAINPGNSGGPLFDLKGQVIGLNTLGFRGGRNGAPLEALNLSLDVTYVHELMNDFSTFALPKVEMAAILGETIRPEESPLAPEAQNLIKTYANRGYRLLGGSTDKSQKFTIVTSNSHQVFPYTFSRQREYAIAVVSQGADNVDLYVGHQASGRLIAKDDAPDASPFVIFRPPQDGVYLVIIRNPSPTRAKCHLVVFEK